MNNLINTNWATDSRELPVDLAEEIAEESLEPVLTGAATAAWEAYMAYDDGVLEEAPEALAAYLDHHTHLDV